MVYVREANLDIILGRLPGWLEIALVCQVPKLSLLGSSDGRVGAVVEANSEVYVITMQRCREYRYNAPVPTRHGRRCNTQPNSAASPAHASRQVHMQP